jgi:energy-coupling factor transport system ATP-binding protein
MIQSQNLCFKYIPSGENAPIQNNLILECINIHIKSGEFIAILGRNGSGKSTLARHLNALLMPTAGTLWVKGLDTRQEENTWDIRQSTGMVFQNPDNQLIASVVEEDVAFGPENLGVPPAEIRTRVDGTLASVGMSDYASFAPHHLSGGQKQRVAIAGVLAMEPDCIVLDEPTAMLDPSGRREVLETVTKLNTESGITVILITHFMDEAVRAKRVMVMDGGRVVRDGFPKDIFRDVKGMRTLGLDVPQVAALAHTLKERGIPLKDIALTIDEFMQEEIIGRIDAKPGDSTPPTETVNEKPVSPPFIEIRALTHIYNRDSVFEKTAIDSITVNITKSEIIGLIGHTGSGKSTLIQHLNVLLKPDSGNVFIGGEDIHADKKRFKKIRERVGLVFQYPEHQLFEVSVYKDVAFGPVKMGLPEAEVDERVRHALSLVGISEDLYEKSPFDLSGGQKRRVAVAGVLAMRPEVLILDEPAAGLDPGGREEILSHIKHMHREMGNTVILVSHSMEDAARLADRILVMNQGKLVCDGTPADVFSQYEFLHGIGLAVPQVNGLMAKLKARNPRVPSDIFTVSEAAAVLYEILKERA